MTVYFTRLPDHSKPEFDEQAHFDTFKQSNVVFNAISSKSCCDNHIGCLSFKTVLSGDESYGINRQQVVVRPGQFLILNNDQVYSSRIDHGEKVRSISIFFKKDFASSVYHDAVKSEKALLDHPFNSFESLEFYQTLYELGPDLQIQLSSLINALENNPCDDAIIDIHLIDLLHYLIHQHKSELYRAKRVNALKLNTKTEIYKRLCIAKDILHSSYMDSPDLKTISLNACLSVPQLVRQFKNVFRTTPHQYLTRIRLRRAADLLRYTNKPVHEITWLCGFENVSAFCRAFKTQYAVQPLHFRNNNLEN
jgi:AraC family transcriptional regulator